MIKRQRLMPAGPRLAGGLGVADGRLTTERSEFLATEISPQCFCKHNHFLDYTHARCAGRSNFGKAQIFNPPPTALGFYQDMGAAYPPCPRRVPRKIGRVVRIDWPSILADLEAIRGGHLPRCDLVLAMFLCAVMACGTKRLQFTEPEGLLSPWCGVTWSATVAGTGSPLASHMTQSGNSRSWCARRRCHLAVEYHGLWVGFSAMCTL